MKGSIQFAGALLAVALVFSGCRSAPPAALAPKGPSPKEQGLARGIRNNCYSLLYELLNQEKRVSLLRFIKREEGDVRQLVKDIAARSAAGAAELEKFAAQDPSLSLTDNWLPQGELDTREAIAVTTKNELLDQSGDRFELTLLVTQAQALSYAAHLAKVAAANDSQPERVHAMQRLSAEMDQLRERVFSLLMLRVH